MVLENFHFHFDINLGQALLTIVLSLLGYGLRQIYKLGVKFFQQIRESEDLIEATASVVDDHSRVLIKAALLPLPVVRLKRRRRIDDPAVFTKDNLS